MRKFAEQAERRRDDAARSARASREAPQPAAAPGPILRLQGALGNQAVSRILRSREGDALDPLREHRAVRAVVGGVAAPAGAPAVIQRTISSFPSSGYELKDDAVADTPEKITRPGQVLSAYGMTCYGTSVMYMIQSYGLVPPDMTREEFEYAFTPLNPDAAARAAGTAKTDDIKVGGKVQTGAKPVDLITKALQGTPTPPKRKSSIGMITSTEATLRGANEGSYTVANIMDRMPLILDAFRKQSDEPNFGFLKRLPASGVGYTPDPKGEKWVNASSELAAGTIGADYFKGGNTVMVGVDLGFPAEGALDHWVVIVRESEKTVTIKRKSYHLYPADDPLRGAVYVMAPRLRSATQDELKAAGLDDTSTPTYNGKKVHMQVGEHAFRRKGA